MVEQTDAEFIAEIGELAEKATADIEENWSISPALSNLMGEAAIAIPRLIKMVEERERERDRLSAVIERDRTKTAESIAALRGIVAGRSWLGEGRGNFAWDDDKYQEEFRGMIEELMAALDPLKVLAADWSDCPKDFQAARIDWKARAEKAEAERDEALREVERLRAAPVSGWRDGNRLLPFDRETLGRMVREAWVRWAQTQPSPKPSWLAPYDKLTEADKEADRQIGEAIARWTLIGDASRGCLASPQPPESKQEPTT